MRTISDVMQNVKSARKRRELTSCRSFVPRVDCSGISGTSQPHPDDRSRYLGGIVTSTFLNMIVIPALYLKYGRAEAIEDAKDLGTQGEVAPTGD